MIRLGHIDYSNCVPVHARLLEPDPPAGIEIVRGVPTELNAALAAGRIDVAPCSSIEYAHHAADYLLLPGLAIASRGAVHSIRFESTRPLDRLHDAAVAVPSASATSVVLLRILLERRYGVRVRMHAFEQQHQDPFQHGAAAALWIGDVALRRNDPTPAVILDLGAEWYAWTGLPFAFALWQARRDAPRVELLRLGALLAESRRYFRLHQVTLAARYSTHFGVPAARLSTYWDSLVYDLPADVQAGLRHFLALAAELGEAPRVDGLEFVASDPKPAPPGA